VLASAAAHVAIVAVAAAGGHGLGSGVAVPATEIEIDTTAPAAPPPADERMGPHDEGSAHVASHTHDYPVAADHDAHPHDPSIDHRIASPTFLPAAAVPGVASAGEPAAAGAVEVAPAAPHFAMVFGQSAVAVGGATSASGTGSTPVTVMPGPSHGDADSPVPEALVSVPARLVASVRPAYPPAARAAEVEADVALTIVVDERGYVVDARLARAASMGFDAAALDAMRRYRFTPAFRNGAPVRVRMGWTMQFRLD
jgi:TonB family protein